MARVPFDTVATFNDKKNNNNVSVNIALQPLLKKLPKQQQPQQLPQSPSYDHVPQPPHLRVDKSTITDPETEAEFQKQHQNQRKQKSRLHSVLDSLKSVFQWTTHSISGGMRNSESFIVENGVRRRGYNKLSRDNNNVAASETSQQHTHQQQGNSGMTLLEQAAAAAEEDKVRRLSNECPSSSYLSTPISEMDEDSDDGHSWDDEELTCNVCDRAFSSPRQLEYHQQKKRHWGCNTCDSLFSTNMSLEHHKELYEHWSDDDYDSMTDDEDFEDYYSQYENSYWCNLRGGHNRIQTEAEFMRNHEQSILLL